MKAESKKSIIRNPRNTKQLGVKTIKFFHQSKGGNSIISTKSLVKPDGVQNPSGLTLAQVRLLSLEDSISVVSSIKGLLIGQIAFRVLNSTDIKLLFTPEENEIFEIKIDAINFSGTIIADTKAINGSGLLERDSKEFLLSEPVKIDSFSSQWPIDVFRNGVPMLRNKQNASLSSDFSIGNYQMVDRGDGFCQILKFNISGSVEGDSITWSTNAMTERPTLSMIQHIDKIHGIVDVMREDLAEVTENDIERYRNNVPTKGDLLAFGNVISKIKNMKIYPREPLLYSARIINSGVNKTPGHGFLYISSEPVGDTSSQLIKKESLATDNGTMTMFVADKKIKATLKIWGTAGVTYGRISLINYNSNNQTIYNVPNPPHSSAATDGLIIVETLIMNKGEKVGFQSADLNVGIAVGMSIVAEEVVEMIHVKDLL